MPRPVSYPFVPRSTAGLRPGQFWAVPLADGRFACGRVLQLGLPRIPAPTRAFFGGLHAWVGEAPPTAEAIAGAGYADAGIMHVRAIVASGGAVLGERPLEAHHVPLPARLSQHGGEGTMLLAGAADVRPATPAEWGRVPALGVWGYDFVTLVAERLAAQGLLAAA